MRKLLTRPWLASLLIGILGSVAFLSFGVLLVVGVLRLAWRGKIFPGITIAGIEVGNLSSAAAAALLDQETSEFLDRPPILSFEGKDWVLDSKKINLRYSLSQNLAQAFAYGRRGKFFAVPDLYQTFTNGNDFPLLYSLDRESLEATLSAIASEISIPGIPPSIKVLDAPDPQTGSRVVLEIGEAGRIMELAFVREQIERRVASLSSDPILVRVRSTPPTTGAVDPQLTRLRAERLLEKKMVLTFSENSDSETTAWELSGEDLVSFLDFDAGFNSTRVASYSASLAESINQPAENATFVFRDGRVIEFAPHKNGLELNQAETIKVLVNAFSLLETNEQEEMAVNLPVHTFPAAITAGDVNNLGIKELLGRGESTFHGSISNREHNITLSSSRISGVLAAPGEIFSFNKAVGDISAATGYRQSYIIKDGRTILDDGGGVCQSSTTLFRAALDAGLPIVERHAHSYRVTYYEQNSKPGLDATVFAPSVDLKFLNDTPSHLLIQSSVDTKTDRLLVEIYGTSDGRLATISNHRTWDVTPPPPDLIQDDPTLPAGSIQQVDWKAWGAKVKFDYKVTRNGETIFEKTFYSNFRPWQSVFLRGTGGV